MSTRIMSLCWPITAEELPGLNPTMKAVLVSLADQANDQGTCWPSVGSMSERTCLAERSVRRAIKTLEQLKLIVMDRRDGISTLYTLQVEILDNLSQRAKARKEAERDAKKAKREAFKAGQTVTPDTESPLTESAREGGHSVRGGCPSVREGVTQCHPNRNRTVTEPSLNQKHVSDDTGLSLVDNSPESLPEKTDSQSDDLPKAVFEYWSQRMQKTSQTLFSPKRRKAVQARIKDGRRLEDFERAIDGCALSPHHMGRNETGTVYDDIELICRSNEHFERFMAKADGPVTPAQMVANGGFLVGQGEQQTPQGRKQKLRAKLRDINDLDW